MFSTMVLYYCNLFFGLSPSSLCFSTTTFRGMALPSSSGEPTLVGPSMELASTGGNLIKCRKEIYRMCYFCSLILGFPLKRWIFKYPVFPCQRNREENIRFTGWSLHFGESGTHCGTTRECFFCHRAGCFKLHLWSPACDGIKLIWVSNKYNKRYFTRNEWTFILTAKMICEYVHCVQSRISPQLQVYKQTDSSR
jgi:hypothetical protein